MAKYDFNGNVSDVMNIQRHFHTEQRVNSTSVDDALNPLGSR